MAPGIYDDEAIMESLHSVKSRLQGETIRLTALKNTDVSKPNGIQKSTRGALTKSMLQFPKSEEENNAPSLLHQPQASKRTAVKSLHRPMARCFSPIEVACRDQHDVGTYAAELGASYRSVSNNSSRVPKNVNSALADGIEEALTKQNGEIRELLDKTVCCRVSLQHRLGRPAASRYGQDHRPKSHGTSMAPLPVQNDNKDINEPPVQQDPLILEEDPTALYERIQLDLEAEIRVLRLQLEEKTKDVMEERKAKKATTHLLATHFLRKVECALMNVLIRPWLELWNDKARKAKPKKPVTAAGVYLATRQMKRMLQIMLCNVRHNAVVAWRSKAEVISTFLLCNLK